MSALPVRHKDTLIFPASLDPDAVNVVRRLCDAGHESYLVGGCVRDLLAGRIPKDFDVSTAARPRQIRRVFRNCRVIGRRFKLAHVHFGEKIIEVATFRRTPEGQAEGERVESESLLILRDNLYGTAEEDALRRDFTVNALLYDVRADEVVDWVGGVEDVRQRVLRTIGDPAIRFAEDPVRMLRAARFASRLDLTPTPEADAALRASAPLIEQSAPPRVLEEIYKLLTCGNAAQALDMLVEYGLLQRLMPEVSDFYAERRDVLRDVGHALDLVDHGSRRVENGFLLASLLLHPWASRVLDQPQDSISLATDMLLPAAQRMSIPRRDVAIARQLLVTQLRLAQNRRSRRIRLSDFLSRPSTHAAIELLYVGALTGLVDPEVHVLWAGRIADPAGPHAGGRLPRGTREPHGPRRVASREREFQDDEDGDEDEISKVGQEVAPVGAMAGEGEDLPRRRRRRGGRRRRGRGSPEREEQPLHLEEHAALPAKAAADAPVPPPPKVSAPLPVPAPPAGRRRGLRAIVGSLLGRVIGRAPAATPPPPPVPPSPVERVARPAPEPFPADAPVEDLARPLPAPPQPVELEPRRRRSRRRRRRGGDDRWREGRGSQPAAQRPEGERRPPPPEAANDTGERTAPPKAEPDRERGRGPRPRRRGRRGEGRHVSGSPRVTETGGHEFIGKAPEPRSNEPDGGEETTAAPAAEPGRERSRGRHSRRGRGGAGAERQRPAPERPPLPKDDDSPDPGSQRHPEDVEDIFDW